MKLRRFLTAKYLFVVLLVALFSLLTYVVNSERTFYIFVDGDKLAITSTQRNPSKLVEEVMSEFDVDDYIIVNDNIENVILTDNSELYVQTRKDLTVEFVNELKPISTYALDVQELLVENNWLVDDENQRYLVVNSSHQKILSDGEHLQIVFEEEVEIEEQYINSQSVEITYVDTLDWNVKVVVDEGQPQIINYLYFVTYQNGVEVAREVIEQTVIQEEIVKKVQIGTRKIAPVTDVVYDNIWDQLAKCESNGNWSINTGNGYYGGLQFAASTWNRAAAAVGIDVSYAHLATKEQQIAAATWVQKHSGWRAWGSCSKKLGLY